jgi:aspartyl-tRNA(Asn)/glutamyl-tRNA(Gln) amidotransferase subunit A
MGEHVSRFDLDRRVFLSLTAGSVAAAMAPAVLAQSRTASDLTALSLHEAAERVRNREVSAVELTQACLARIDRYDGQINAFISVTRELALAQARVAEKDIRAGQYRGPLHGIPIALKDNIDTSGIRTTAASAVYANRVPSHDAEIARRLKAAGAVLLGKLNMNEFALGIDGIGSFWGPTRNPWDQECIPGGSSSGPAAAVAADFCFAALGTDTSGSVRIPAALCGIVGFKPTYGLVSIGGVIPLVESLDHVGPLCKTVQDSALVLQAIAGHDPAWVASRHAPIPNYSAALADKSAPPRLGIPRAYFFDQLEPEVADAFAAALRVLRSLSSGVKDHVTIPDNINYLTPPLWAEGFAYQQELFERQPNLYQPAVRKWLREGLQGASRISGVDYVLARKELERMRREAPAIFQECDLLVMPTWKEPAMKIDDRLQELASKDDPPPKLYNTVPFNPLGLPAITVPCGFTHAGLPVGLQIVGPPLSETKVLALAYAYEQATPWHLRKPKLPG